MNAHPTRTPRGFTMHCWTGRLGASIGFLATLILFVGCRTAKVTNERHLGDAPAQPASIVYVEDLDLGPNGVESEKGILSRVPVVGREADKVLYGQKPPAVRAQELTDLMSRSLVKDIEKAGYVAQRFYPGDTMPTNGWLVRGVFTEVQQGNRLRRAMIGFGLGKTDLQAVTKFDDLSEGKPEPFYEMSTDANSGHLPGAAPMLIISPYAAPVRFVLAGGDLDRSVRQTAAQISKALVTEIQGESIAGKPHAQQ